MPTNYHYDFEAPLDVIHEAEAAFENAKPQLFTAPQALLGKEIHIAHGAGLLNIWVKLAEKSGIAVLEVTAQHEDDADKRSFTVPVLQAQISEISIGYGHYIFPLLYGSLFQDNEGEDHWTFDADNYNLIDHAINQFLAEHAEIYNHPFNSEAVKSVSTVELANLQLLGMESFDFHDGEIELAIGVHDGNLEVSFVTFNNWRTNEFGEDTADMYRFPLPETLKPLDRDTLLAQMKKTECYDSITYLWVEDFGEDANKDELFDLVVEKLNSYLPFLNGLKLLYGKK